MRRQNHKPYPEFPLSLHPNGQWYKKINGKFYYFGTDPQEALKLFQEQRDDLYAGRRPRRNGEPILADALDQFLSAKKQLLDSGELSSSSYTDYVQTCDKLAESLGLKRALTDIHQSDLEKLRADLAKGKRLSPEGKPILVGASTHKGDLTRARMVLLYINENFTPIQYRKALKSPPRKLLRKVANEAGERMFEAKQIREMIEMATQPLSAMIWLGINCGFANNDCATLPLDKLDLVNGWHAYARPKTHNPRRCPLWKETIESLRDAIDRRPKPQRGNEKLVFLTPDGGVWTAENDQSLICKPFQKLLIDLGIYRTRCTFQSLRRTFETVAAETGQQVAVDFIMGHVAAESDMAARYRQKVYNNPLLTVVSRVHDWLLGGRNIV